MGQGAPPGAAATMMLRWRDCWPPAQSFVHASHAVHSPYAQFTAGQAVATEHSFCSVTLPTHPSPPCPLILATTRTRVVCPVPHFAVQADHAPQAANSQLATPHAFMAQGRVFTNIVSQATPPPDAGMFSCRFCCCCPPPQVLSQASHVVHSESTQSCIPGPQVPSSSRLPLHGVDPKRPIVAICLTRFL